MQGNLLSQTVEQACGCDHALLISDLSTCEGVVPAPVGDIAVSWKKKGRASFSVRVRGPKGTTAQVWLPPAAEHLVDGEPAGRSSRVTALAEVADGSILTLKAGEHELVANGLRDGE